MCENKWTLPPANLSLLSDEVHIWRVSTDEQSEESLKYLYSILSASERERAVRFCFEKDKKQYITSRGYLRIILGRYLEIDPEDLVFSYNKYGKPYLEGALAGDYLSFNLSHSGSITLYAVTLFRRVGIDIEQVNPDRHSDDIVNHCFSEEEKVEYNSLPEYLKEKAFFTCWSRKEAYIKAHGKGMSIPLDEFSVSMLPGEPVRLKHDQIIDNETSRWMFKDPLPIESYSAALAVEGDGLNFLYWHSRI